MQSMKQNGIAFAKSFLPKNDDAAYINNIQMPLGGRPRGICLFGLQQIVKEADILFLEREFPGLLLFHDLDDAVVDGRGNTALAAPFAHDAVDRVDLAGLALFEILQHGWRGAFSLRWGQEAPQWRA